MVRFRRWALIFLVGGIFFALLGLGLRVYSVIVIFFGWNLAGDDEILDVYKVLEIDQTQEQAKTVFAARAYKYLKLIETPENGWMIRTPIRFDVKNLLLFVTFENGTVCAVRIRYQDSSNAFPINAPPDKETPDCPPNEKLVIHWKY
ncbi:MAG TPA: hypothetical protein PLI09_11155 [Candidatus Hydrogenedentes bacterium]|nr:hypothetical protein [Candidatus Hydrogenedentota bacterium]